MQRTEKNQNLAQKLILIAVFLAPFYFFRFSVGPVRTNIFEIAVAMAFIVSVCAALISKRQIRTGSILSVLFLIIAFISIFTSPDMISAVGIFKGWFLVPIILYYIIVNFVSESEAYKLNFAVYASLIIISFWGVFQGLDLVGALFYQSGDPNFAQYLVSGNLRVFGPFESPNYLAMFLVPAFFLSLPVLSLTQKKTKPVYFLSLIPFAITVVAIVMTDSRAGLIAFALSFIALLGLKMQQRPKAVKTGLIVLGLIVMSISGWLLLGQTLNRQGSNDARHAIYTYAWEIGRDNPVLGIGLDGFSAEITERSQENAKFQAETLSYAYHPHNLYLQLWLSLGLAGLVVFLLILIHFFRSVWPSRDQLISQCLIAAMLAILIHGLFDTTYFKNDLSAIFWLIIALSQVNIKTNNAQN